MSDVDDLRRAIAAALNTIDGWSCHSDGYMRDQVNAPEFMIDYEVGYDLVFARGADTYTFTVLAFDKRTSERSAQTRFDRLRDGSRTDSVKYVLENDSAIAAVLENGYLRVRSAGRPQAISVGATDYLLVEFSCEVVL